MAAYTPKYHLKKPAPTDFVDISDLNGNMDIIDEALDGKADLDESGKVASEQLPDFILTSEKGQAGGVATLDADGKIPASQIGAAGVSPQLIVTVPSGSAVSCTDGESTFSRTSTGTAIVFELPDYGAWTVSASLGALEASETVNVDIVKQYEITLEYFSATLRVTSEAGAVVTAQSSEKTYSGTVPVGSTYVDLMIPVAGTYTVSAAKDGKTSNSVTVAVTDDGETYTAACLFLSSVLSENSWANIAAASAAGLADDTWEVGDEIDITVSGETLTLMIMDFDHDDLAEGGKAGITFGTKNLMTEARKMNDTRDSTGGYTASDLYQWLQNTLYPGLPSDLQAVLKTVNKLTLESGSAETASTAAVKLFLFSWGEVSSEADAQSKKEGTLYSCFPTRESRVKYLSNGSGAAHEWWTRSPMGDDSFYAVSKDGFYDEFGFADSEYGVCFGFCV